MCLATYANAAVDLSLAAVQQTLLSLALLIASPARAMPNRMDDETEKNAQQSVEQNRIAKRHGGRNRLETARNSALGGTLNKEGNPAWFCYYGGGEGGGGVREFKGR